jgi:hypothetical protein|tara:strand:+ start:485 stop:853 length:369 start_codon:yes stop_codon:yes gene_type:complete
LKKKISGNAEGSIQSLFGNLDPAKFYDVEVEEHKDSRSIQQNKRYWALVTEMSSYLGHTTDEVHDLMRYKFLSFKELVGNEEITRVPSTTGLKIKAFNEYCNQVEQFAYGLGFRLDLEQYGY